MTTYGWHFLYEGHKLRDGTTAPKDGQWLEVKNPVICERGLHGSRTAYDALRYAPGPILCLCEFSNPTEIQDDKFVSERRRIIARMDATEVLWYFGRMQALSVVHAWDAPDIVLDYLMTGDETIRSAARSAADSAAWSAARSATESAAWSATESAAWSATESAARSVVELELWLAAWSAARKDLNTLIYECFQGPMKNIGMKGTL